MSTTSEVTKKKRNRDRNWTLEEKQLLRCAIQPYWKVINSQIFKKAALKRKDAAWRKIAAKLRPHGIDFSLQKIKQQWARMKIQERQRAKGLPRSRNLPTNRILLRLPQTIETVDESADGDTDCEVSDFDTGSPTMEEKMSTTEVVNLKKQIHERQMEQITIAIAHEAELAKLRKELELKKLELIELQFKKELKKGRFKDIQIPN